MDEAGTEWWQRKWPMPAHGACSPALAAEVMLAVSFTQGHVWVSRGGGGVVTQPLQRLWEPHQHAPPDSSHRARLDAKGHTASLPRHSTQLTWPQRGQKPVGPWVSPRHTC